MQTGGSNTPIADIQKNPTMSLVTTIIIISSIINYPTMEYTNNTENYVHQQNARQVVPNKRRISNHTYSGIIDANMNIKQIFSSC